MKQKLSYSIDKLNLPLRIENALRRAGYNNLNDLRGQKYSQLLKVRGVGKDALVEIAQKCDKLGVVLIDDRPDKGVKKGSRLRFVTLDNGNVQITAIFDEERQELRFGAMPLSTSLERGFVMKEIK